MRVIALLLVVLFVSAQAGAADLRAEFNRRAANADMAAFKQLDLNRDGRVAYEEAKADLNFVPRFDDIDINRDGYITIDELRRYIEQTYGVQPASSN